MFILSHRILRVKDGRLIGRHLFHWEEIPVEEIECAGELGFRNRLLWVRTRAGRHYAVGVLSPHYKEVLGFLEDHVDPRFRETAEHFVTEFFYRFGWLKLLAAPFLLPIRLLARKYIEKEHEVKPPSCSDYFKRGMENAAKGAYDVAIQDYDRTIELSPIRAELYYHRAVAYSHKGDYDKAWADARKARELGHEPADDLVAQLRVKTGKRPDPCE